MQRLSWAVSISCLVAGENGGSKASSQKLVNGDHVYEAAVERLGGRGPIVLAIDLVFQERGLS